MQKNTDLLIRRLPFGPAPAGATAPAEPGTTLGSEHSTGIQSGPAVREGRDQRHPGGYGTCCLLSVTADIRAQAYVVDLFRDAQAEAVRAGLT